MLWLVILVVAVIAFVVVRKNLKSKDQPLTLETFATEAKTEVKSALDLNNDGKVNLADAVVAGEKVKAVAKKGAAKAKTAAKKAKSKLKVAK